ncbi:hypothetical protein ACNJYA_09620 [Bradyrhizobium sp. DASA03068]|uniref:hypothetical protein n=1 Tax=Bradyrhizobium sp. BLXBL-01 TaxID=3395915 RepID=UPI003F7157BC
MLLLSLTFSTMNEVLLTSFRSRGALGLTSAFSRVTVLPARPSSGFRGCGYDLRFWPCKQVASP